MGNFFENPMDTYEKKMPVFMIYRMAQEGRIVFPVTPSEKKSKKIENVSKMVEAMLLGIALPIVYVSERQNGSLLVLDAEDRLMHLIGFLHGDYPMMGLEFYPDLEGYGIEQLERQFPRVTSQLYDYQITLQVIEYTTPKYMHMQVGKYVGQWNFTREQGIRNELYGDKPKYYLNFLVQFLNQSVYFLSRRKLNRQYMALRILMYRFVATGIIQMKEKHLGLQLLLDRTMKTLENMDGVWLEQVADEFSRATEELIGWERRVGFHLAEEKGKEGQAKVLGYLYNVVWICWKKGCEAQKGLETIVFDPLLWQKISEEKVDFVHIQRHFDEIEERLW